MVGGQCGSYNGQAEGGREDHEVHGQGFSIWAKQFDANRGRDAGGQWRKDISHIPAPFFAQQDTAIHAFNPSDPP